MKKTKLLKSILIPTLGITSIGTIAAVSTSCGQIQVTGVILNENTKSIGLGDTYELIATVLPENATNKTVTWNSNNKSVATVVNGRITAVGLGNAAITVTTHDGGYTATCDVVVIIKQYVAITANKDSTLELNNKGKNNPDLQYSTDDGASWITYSEEINIGQGQTLYLKGSNPNGWSTSSSSYSCLSIKGNISVSGNVMALLDNGAQTGESGDITDIPCNYCFYDLFRDSTGITSVSEDFLPATTLKDHCYSYMFEKCTSLTNAPKLSSMSLAGGCYEHMFHSCTSLATAPELPATTLANYCYYSMFQDCSSLNSIKISYIGIYDSKYFYYWVYGVADSGIFYYNGEDTVTNFGFPSDWNIQKF